MPTIGEIDERSIIVVHATVVGYGYCDSTVEAEVCADRVQGTGWKADSNFFPNGPTHCDDDRTAGVIADASGAGAGSIVGQ